MPQQSELPPPTRVDPSEEERVRLDGSAEVGVWVVVSTDEDATDPHGGSLSKTGLRDSAMPPKLAIMATVHTAFW